MSNLPHLRAALDAAAHLLPTQGPIGVFVHHNTLHTFQDRPFLDAVEQAAELFGAEPYLSEARFRAEHDRGRITRLELELELDAALERCGGDRELLGGLRRRELWRLLLLHPIADLRGAALRWTLGEGQRARRLREDLPPEARRGVLQAARVMWEQALERGAGPAELGALLTGSIDPRRSDALLRETLGIPATRRALEQLVWRDPEGLAAASLQSACRAAVEHAAAAVEPSPLRLRDQLQRAGREDPDELVHPLLIRWLSAFLDQGQAYWPLPNRERGLFRALTELWSQPGILLEAWQVGLRAELAAIVREQRDPEQVALERLQRLAPSPESWEALIRATLLALPGWSGLVHLFERDPEQAPHHAPPARLMDLLALRLVLDEHAARYVGGGSPPVVPRPDPEAQVWLLREVAELAGLGPAALRASSPTQVEELFAELHGFDHVARRRVWHLAYERQHRDQLLEALASHWAETQASAPRAPRIQAVFCIDEREESLRRALEEQGQQFETLGAAGFYGLAIRYQGLDDPRVAPLAPVGAVCSHVIRERPLRGEAAQHAQRRERRRLLGRLLHTAIVESRHALGGLLATVGLGLVSAFPLLARVLFPRTSAHLWTRWAAALAARPRTELSALRTEEPADGELPVGFTVDEAVERVGRLLEDMGLTRGFSPLVGVFGHGSQSLNNPHESAHDCGACSGRHGGPNARLFAVLANHPEVRAGLQQERGIEIPGTTWFVGGFHDTCTSGVSYFDLDRVPASHRDLLAELQVGLKRAQALSAHERCRRFESAPHGLTPEEALRHVESRAVHLAEPRPEYGHATNAVCLVGRRSWSRGLFLDRRAFLVSYDPEIDPDLEILTRLISAVGPVGAGINLEYYFSYVDNERYGCGTKLPHNITSLVGVMNGHRSDLRTGLPWQMVEIHEPVRLVTVVEATPDALLEVARRSAPVNELVTGGWISLVSLHPETGALSWFDPALQAFVDWTPRAQPRPTASTSADYYAGERGHLPPARIAAALEPAA